MAQIIKNCSLKSSSTYETAEEAIRVWKERPNVVNRRLCGCGNFWSKSYERKIENKKDPTFIKSLKDEIIEQLTEVKSISTDIQASVDLNQTLNAILDFAFGVRPIKNDDDRKYIGEEASGMTLDLTLRKLLPRSLKKFKITVELMVSFVKTCSGVPFSTINWFMPLVVLDGEHANFREEMLLALSYGISYQQLNKTNGRFDLLTTTKFHEGATPTGTLCANLPWLKETLLPKLKNWSETFKQEDFASSEKKLHSLSLVDVEKYARVYNEMKAKYAQSLIEAWQENTDPQKFVFEDISIASYLIVLWEEERIKNNKEEKQSFVDLGCGNGLLVYLLSQEGYNGKGVDIRRRNIWDQYGTSTVLLEESLHPHCCTFEDTDWIIGNHSDELTPWIPVIAARSSYKTKYFLLPCCFHDFTGKFKKNCHDSSQYQTYLDYVREIGTECGFVIEQDIQRIPSTKRTCHIARKRSYLETEQHEIENKVQSLLAKRSCHLKLDDVTCVNAAEHDRETCHTADSKHTQSTGNKFLPREAKETVRNCTQIDKDVKNSIIEKVTTALLKSERKYEGDHNSFTSKGRRCSNWNCGGSLPLAEVTSLLTKETLQELKSQCGGLQTLLRNHGHIFKVVKGEVILRNYKNPEEHINRRSKKGGKTKPKSNYKTKLCWFHFNHPDGCILLDKECQFAHNELELRAT